MIAPSSPDLHDLKRGKKINCNVIKLYIFQYLFIVNTKWRKNIYDKPCTKNADQNQKNSNQKRNWPGKWQNIVMYNQSANSKTPKTKRTKQCSDCLSSIRGDGQNIIVIEGKYSLRSYAWIMRGEEKNWLDNYLKPLFIFKMEMIIDTTIPKQYFGKKEKV